MDGSTDFTSTCLDITATMYGGSYTVTHKYDTMYGGSYTVTHKHYTMYGGSYTVTHKYYTMYGGSYTVTHKYYTTYGGSYTVTHKYYTHQLIACQAYYCTLSRHLAPHLFLSTGLICILATLTNKCLYTCTYRLFEQLRIQYLVYM